MSWKVYSLGSLGSAQGIANAAIPNLEALGYTVTYTNSANYEGTLAITVGGTVYSCSLNIANGTGYPTYLMVNVDTNEIVIGQTGRNAGSTDQLCYIASLALLRGTSAKTGERGLFPVLTSTQAKNFTNWWGRFDNTAEQIYLQRAVFFKYAFTETVIYNENPFVADNIYWATALYTPGATVAVGGETFVCINGCMFAKL